MHDSAFGKVAGGYPCLVRRGTHLSSERNYSASGYDGKMPGFVQFTDAAGDGFRI
jgi:hypothetical protein